MHKFDTKVQLLKYKVLREVAKHAWDGTLAEHVLDIPEVISPGKIPETRCCVYKERAINAERVKIAMGGNKDIKSIIQVIDIACDECPAAGYVVSQNCRGCLAHRCMDACPKDAIYLDRNHVAHIDKSKCVECGACAKACPYSAIANLKRPCQNACKIKAISIGDDDSAVINYDKCIECGACVYQCPFGAIVDKSFILDAIDIIKKSDNNNNYKVYAVIAPSISSQFRYATLGQVISGIKKLGFFTTVEAALGADIVAFNESKELAEKGLVTSSCCPAFVSYIEKFFPALTKYISHNLSPMATIASFIKETDPTAKVIFIGPCTAKKAEYQREEVSKYVDCVITFEELQALIDSKEIDLTSLEEGLLDNASYFGRIFARSGGITDAVRQGLKEHGLDDFEYKPCTCDGIEQCRIALLKLSKGVLDANFIEGMACSQGCIGGAGCLTHGEKNKTEVDKYGHDAYENTITGAISTIEKLRKK